LPLSEIGNASPNVSLPLSEIGNAIPNVSLPLSKMGNAPPDVGRLELDHRVDRTHQHDVARVAGIGSHGEFLRSSWRWSRAAQREESSRISPASSSHRSRHRDGIHRR
jgi:hypothetical protein